MKKTQLISTLLLIAMLAGCGTTESGNDETTSSGADTTEETTAEHQREGRSARRSRHSPEGSCGYSTDKVNRERGARSAK